MDAHDLDAPHVVPLRVYLGVFFTLMVLTAVTVAVAFVDLGAMNNVVMLGVAVTKATLVILYFMHVRYSDRLNGLVVAGGFAFMLLMVLGTLLDLLSRGWIGFPGG